MYMADNNNSTAMEETALKRIKNNITWENLWKIVKRSVGDLIMSYGAVLLAFFVRRVANQQEDWIKIDNEIISNVLIIIAFALLLARQKFVSHFNNANQSVIEHLILISAFLSMILFVIALTLSECDWELIKLFMNVGIILSFIACFLSNIDLKEMELDKKIRNSNKNKAGNVGNKKFKL